MVSKACRDSNEMARWPSGLRRRIQVPLSKDARVRIPFLSTPSQTLFFRPFLPLPLGIFNTLFQLIVNLRVNLRSLYLYSVTLCFNASFWTLQLYETKVYLIFSAVNDEEKKKKKKTMHSLNPVPVPILSNRNSSISKESDVSELDPSGADIVIVKKIRSNPERPTWWCRGCCFLTKTGNTIVKVCLWQIQR